MDPRHQGTHHTTVIVTEGINYGPSSQSVVCPHCNYRVNTKIKHKSNAGTHIGALLCCFFCWPCFCCPYCCASCMDVNHYCPKCKQFLGTYKG
nr:lipopolysaccharide-induced tumor necrosis factor-alpha factor homolog [Onthophagus taurus]